MDQTVERELHELLDRDRIVALASRYFAGVDDGRSLDAEWAGTIFSPDLRIEHRGVTLTGLEEVAAGNRFVRDGWDRTFHASTDHRVEVHGDEAHLTARLLAVHEHREPGPSTPYVIANVVDADAVRTSDGWRFRSLGFRTVWSRGQSHVDLGPSDR